MASTYGDLITKKNTTIPVKIKLKRKDGTTTFIKAKKIIIKPTKIKFPFVKKSFKSKKIKSKRRKK